MAAAGKKLLVLMAGNKDGRRVLGYVIGIAVFICFLPLIAAVGLFGWISGGDAFGSEYKSFPQKLPEELVVQAERYDTVLSGIERAFNEECLSEEDIYTAKIVFLSYLTGREHEPEFFVRLTACFSGEAPGETLSDRLAYMFNIEVQSQYFDKGS